MTDGLAGYWSSRFVFERALALIYLTAFICAANQFVPLLGERGLLPAARFIRVVPFRASPSLFYAASSDMTFRTASWLGIALSLVALTGLASRSTLGSAAVWFALWILYLSFVNVGQIFYGFGWESMLLETGFLAIFLGSRASAPSIAIIWMVRWILFRDMFGAGLIKLRGDPCWRQLTCLDYYFETQPIPNAVSWYFHWMPAAVHRAGVVFNHIAELGIPFLYFAPQPVAGIAGLITIVFQLTLIVSGNLSWLNWLTIVLCIPTLDDRWWSWLHITAPALVAPSSTQQTVTYTVAGLVGIMSIQPIVNMLSAGQLMNASFNPLHLVNTYGAFGSITQQRHEIVIEGTDDDPRSGSADWKPYEFKGKPGDEARLPPQIAPYHLRLDWLMWFAAMAPPSQHPWFGTLLVKLLEGDPAILGLLKTAPFPDHPPRYVRAMYYEYRFTPPAEHRQTGHWWNRMPIGLYAGPMTLNRSSRR